MAEEKFLRYIPENEPTSQHYVQDGLIAWYDGIDNTRHGHDANATGWENLVSESFDLSFSATAPAIQTNHLRFNGNGYAYNLVSPSFLGAYEIVFSVDSVSRNQHILAVNRGQTDPSSGTGLSLYGKSIFVGRGNPCVTFGLSNVSDNSIQTAYIYGNASNGILALDGIEQTKIGSSWWPVGWGGFSLGSSTDQSLSYSMVGNIYCVRAYNRILTAEEMMQNHLVDKARFNF